MKFIYILVFCLITSTAVAQITCAPRSVIVSELAEKYKEKQTAMGLETNGRLIEVFVSNNGSFTILVSYPNNLSCIATSGENWQTINLTIKQ
jgi:hypothetical protein